MSTTTGVTKFILSLPWGQFYAVRKLIFNYAVCNLKQAMARERCRKIREELLRKQRQHLVSRFTLKGFSLRAQNNYWTNYFYEVATNTKFVHDFKGGCFTLSPSSRRLDSRYVNYPPAGKYCKYWKKKLRMHMTLPIRYYLDAHNSPN